MDNQRLILFVGLAGVLMLFRNLAKSFYVFVFIGIAIRLRQAADDLKCFTMIARSLIRLRKQCAQPGLIRALL